MKKNECIQSENCQWIVGSGCRQKINPPQTCEKKRKVDCISPCRWENRKCHNPTKVSSPARREERKSPVLSNCEKKRKVDCISPCRWENRKCHNPTKVSSPARREEKGDCISRSVLKPLPHQIKVINWLRNNRGIIAVHSVGSGKTLTAVVSSQCFLDDNPRASVIVVSPKSLVSNFKKEMLNYGLDENDNRYQFYSFEKFVRLFKEKGDYRKICKGNFLIIDEAHVVKTKVQSSKLDDLNLNEPESPSSRLSVESKEEKESLSKSTTMVNCAKLVDKILLLTATPFVNQSFDMANLLAMVKGENPLNANEWSRMLENEKEKKAYFKNCFSFYETSKENYPRRIDKNIKLEMDKKFFKEYRKIEEKHEETLQKYLMGDHPESFLTGFRTALLTLPDSSKIKYALEKIKEVLNLNKKIVIFSNFINAGIKKIEEYLDEHKIGYKSITGRTNAKDRKTAIDDYNNGKIKVFLISKAGGVGLDLKETHTMIVLDIPWNKATLEQAIGRTVRYKSHENLPPNERVVHVYVLYCVKPKSFIGSVMSRVGLENPEKLPSVDILMDNIIKRKYEEEKMMMDCIRQNSI
jgi:SNF2 family DNA or RNA helicase